MTKVLTTQLQEKGCDAISGFRGMRRKHLVAAFYRVRLSATASHVREDGEQEAIHERRHQRLQLIENLHLAI
jgi:hypothetical protein